MERAQYQMTILLSLLLLSLLLLSGHEVKYIALDSVCSNIPHILILYEAGSYRTITLEYTL